MNIQTNKIFFSVFKGQDRLLDMTNHNQVIGLLSLWDIPFFEVEGCYQGITEKSICVYTDNGEKFEAWTKLIFNLAKKTEQDSILLVHNDGIGQLVYMDGRPSITIGKMKLVSQEEALKQDAYTKHGDSYYIMA